MRHRTGFVIVSLSMAAAGALLGHAGQKANGGPPAGAAANSGLDHRVPWTTSKVIGSPDPPSPFKTEFAFPKLKMDEPLDMTNAPGSDRLFITERYGRVLTIPPNPQLEKPDVLIDLNQVFHRNPRTIVLYGFAAHPRFAENGYVYITIIPNPERAEEPMGTRVSRFKVVSHDPPRCDPKSEQVIIEWPSGGHNGGCLKFGPDGFLYIATGDSSGINDQYQTGQNLTSLAGKILRIDVDHPEAGRPYGIPKDNPFVGQPSVRPEIYAYGLRQPWKMSFDPATGDLWTGNVGQDLWEQIYRIEAGGNYGWSVLEGSHSFRPERPRGPSPILMPTVEHDHANFRSITGGFVYRGKRLKDLIGAYVYGDYDTGRIWSFRFDRDKKTVSEHRELYKSNIRLVCFGEDNAGELYLLDHMAGRISRLVPNPAVNNAAQFPRKLSDTGIFASTKDHQVSPGIIPYSVIAPQWCDGATKERFLGIPGGGKIDFEGMLYPGAPGAPPGWKFPDGAVLAETIAMEMELGNPASRKRIETRVLHHQRLYGTEEVGDQYWQGYSYVWNDDQSDAVLLEDPQGRDLKLMLTDRDAADGKRQQTWHVPSRTECIACHNMAAKYVIGMQTAQMNRDHDYGGRVANQIRTLEHIDLFSKPLPTPPEKMAQLADYRDAKQDLNLRARSYLHANCSHCHRRWGGGNAEFQLIATWELGDMGIVGVRPAHGTFNIPNAKILAPRDPYRSVLFYRMSTVGPGRMPRIGSSVADQAGVELIHDWIASLPGTGLQTAEEAVHGSAEVQEVRRLSAAFKNGLAADQYAEKLNPFLATPGSALRLAHLLGTREVPASAGAAAAALAAKVESTEVRDLFERFLPEGQRIKRLGATVQPEQILAIPGDAARGRKLFFESSGVLCKSCHRIGGQGTEVGPDLDQIGKKYDRAKILDNILNPSKEIEQKYLLWQVETKQGKVYSGLLVSKDDAKVVLKDAQNKLAEIAAGDIELMVSQQKSLMPELLLRDFTAEQVADLTTFLSTLK
jgi:uncharacterized repeat protein (TIGR03806 family)